MIVPIGVDCGMANFCKKHNLRYTSFPFDWNVTYNGVSECINDNFNNFIPNEYERINAYDIFFLHDFENTYHEDVIKYKRRIQRLQNILETTEEIIFCRKGHSPHHHYEHNEKYSNIKSDIKDAEDLDRILSNKYPNLNYKIIVILVCEKCFDSNKIYKSNSDKIEIHNISSPVVDDAKFEKCANEIFCKQIALNV